MRNVTGQLKRTIQDQTLYWRPSDIAKFFYKLGVWEDIALIAKNPLLRAIAWWMYWTNTFRLPISNTCIVVFIYIITWLLTWWHIGRTNGNIIHFSAFLLEKSADMKNAISLYLAGWCCNVFLLHVFNLSWSPLHLKYGAHAISLILYTNNFPVWFYWAAGTSIWISRFRSWPLDLYGNFTQCTMYSIFAKFLLGANWLH